MRLDVSLNFVYGSLKPESRVAAAIAAGFDAVEMWWPFDGPSPSDREIATLAATLRNSGATLAALNFYAGDVARGDRGLVSLPGRQAEFRESVHAAIELARQAGGCPIFSALYGNRDESWSPDEQEAVAIANYAFAVAAAELLGARVVLEALNSYENPRYPIASTEGALNCLDRIRAESGCTVWYLLDTYHLGRMDESLIAVVQQHPHRIGHVQVADVPGRHEPGTGAIDFRAVFRALRDAGYEGSIGLEYHPTADPDSSFGWIDDMRAELGTRG